MPYKDGLTTEQKRKYNIKKRYGLTPLQLDEMWDQCDGLCVICHLRPPHCVDHCHDTKEVRGLLCRQCNTGLGMLGDDQELLARAMCYLAKHDKRSNPRPPARHKGRRAGSDSSLPKTNPKRPNS